MIVIVRFVGVRWGICVGMIMVMRVVMVVASLVLVLGLRMAGERF
jgi:hypothetical protein